MKKNIYFMIVLAAMLLCSNFVMGQVSYMYRFHCNIDTNGRETNVNMWPNSKIQITFTENYNKIHSDYPGIDSAGLNGTLQSNSDGVLTYRMYGKDFLSGNAFWTDDYYCFPSDLSRLNTIVDNGVPNNGRTVVYLRIDQVKPKHLY